MKSLIIYDSNYGNTSKIADEIYQVLSESSDCIITNVKDIKPEFFRGLDLLIVGTPTIGGRSTQAINAFLSKLPPKLSGIKVAAFDTRLSSKDHGIGIKLIMRFAGYAAPKMADALVSKGGTLIGSPEGFIVQDKEGVLVEGELERARNWAHHLKTK